MFKKQEELFQEIKTKIIDECSKSKFGLSVIDEKIIPVAEQQKWHEQDIFHGLKIDTLQILHFGGKLPEIFMVIPWSRKVMLPFEIFSICSGNLPFPVALKNNKKWVAHDKKGYHRIVDKLNKYEDFSSGIAWSWSTFEHSGTLQWGIQAVPLNEAEYLFSVQTAVKKGLAKNKSYLDWFVEKRDLLVPIIDGIKSSGEQELKTIFSAQSFMAVVKLWPEKLSDYFGKGDNTISAEDAVVTEVEYNEIMNGLVEKAVVLFNEEHVEFQAKIIKRKINEVTKKVIEKNTDDVQKLHQHLIVFKKMKNKILLESQISRDLTRKLKVKVTGVDEKAQNKIGCVLFLILIPLVYIIWGNPLGFLPTWLKIFLTFLGVAGLGFLQDSMRNKITKKKSVIESFKE